MLDKLKELNKFDNALILFLSDNGSSAEDVQIGTGPIGSMTRWASLQEHWANVGNTPFRFYKNYSFEGGINTPMIAHWPAGIKNPGRFSDTTGHFIDLMPTLTARWPEPVTRASLTDERLYPARDRVLLQCLRVKKLIAKKTDLLAVEPGAGCPQRKVEVGSPGAKPMKHPGSYMTWKPTEPKQSIWPKNIRQS